MTELTTALVPLLGEALLHFLWQGALIGVFAALALAALRDARPQTRYVVACLALLACVLAPVLTMLWPLFDAGVAVGDVPTTGAATTTLATATALLSYVTPATGIEAWHPAIVATWAAGMGMVSLRIVFGLAWVRRLPLADDRVQRLVWQTRLDVMAMHFGLSRAVELRLVHSLESPAASGWVRPVVLLPLALLTRMPADLVEALLAHELAHIRRHDYLVNLLQNAVEAVLFYHPVVWWLSHRIRVEREQIADQLAAEVECAPRRLALALAELSELQRSAPALHLLQAAQGGHLMSRIERLVRPASRSHPVARIVFPLLGVLAAGLATFAYAQAAKDHGGFSSLSIIADSSSERFALVSRKAKGDEILANMTIGGPDDDMKDVEAAKRHIAGDFLWARRDGRKVVITDPAVLARVHEAWRATEAQSEKMDALSEQMDVHSDAMDVLSDRMEALADGDIEDSPEMRAAEREAEQMEQVEEELAAKQEALAERMGDVDEEADVEKYRALERELEAVARQQEVMARKHERYAEVMEAEAARMERNRAPMEALSREMEAASKPMEALGKQMDLLAQQHEKLEQQAQRETRRIIDEAMQRNLAKPAPTR